jgi:hypothetical protein
MIHHLAQTAGRSGHGVVGKLAESVALQIGQRCELLDRHEGLADVTIPCRPKARMYQRHAASTNDGWRALSCWCL